MKSRVFITLFLLICLSCSVWGQYDDGGRPIIFSKRTSGTIKVDGQLDDPVWQGVIPSSAFWQYFPADTIRADQQTEIYMRYDDEYLYVATKCYAAGADYVVPSLRRDYRAGGSDNITLVFDPFNDNTNAFVFGLNPFGVQREALISNGGNNIPRDWDSSWDAKWEGDAQMYEDHWIAEFAIPFRSIRFKEGSTKW
ncbi:MAG: carbohydrate binding family 9 domain-containing protein [Bacteroidota bacterium]